MRRADGFVWFAAALLIAAFGLRIGGIDDRSLWNDEGNSVVQALRSPEAIIQNAALDIHPPGYYLLLSIWTSYTGTSELALRGLSAFASLIMVALACAIGRRLYGAPAGLVAGAITALHSFSLFYAGEARMYALLALWVAGLFWLILLLLERPTAGRAGALAVVTAAGLYTQYAFPLFMLAGGAVVVLWAGYRLRREPRTVGRAVGLFALANLVAIAAFAPWLPTALAQIGSWTAIPTGGTPPLEAFAALVRALLMGIAPVEGAQSIPLLLMLFGAITPPEGRDRWRWLLPIAWTLIPVIAFVAIGAYSPDDVKLMLPAQVGVALWIARGVWVLWTGRALAVRARVRVMTGRPMREGDAAPRERLVRNAMSLTALLSIAWLLLALAGGLAGVRGDPTLQRGDYRAIAALITADERPDDAIILTAPNQNEVFMYYYMAYAPVYALPYALTVDDAATRASVEEIIGQHDRIYAVFWGEGERDPRRVVESTLDSLAYAIDDRWYGDVRLARYVTPDQVSPVVGCATRFTNGITLDGCALNGRRFTAPDAIQIALDWRTDDPPDARYKVFVQLLNPDGTLAVGRDSEPGGGLAPTTTWAPGQSVSDRHAIPVSADLTPGVYSLIVGLYPLDDPDARLLTEDGADHTVIAAIRVGDSPQN